MDAAVDLVLGPPGFAALLDREAQLLASVHQ